MNYEVPREDLSEFYTLPEGVRDDVQLTLAILQRIAAADRLQAAIRAEAKGLHGRRGFSEASLNRKRRLFRESDGDWHVLVDGARLKARHGMKRAKGLSREFVEYWRSLCDENGRKFRPAYRKLLRKWQAGEVVPGYGTWVDWFMEICPDVPTPMLCPPDLPRGWGRRNLMRYVPDRTETMITRRGITAARNTLPTLIGTRKGLRFLEVVVLDDWRSDFRVNAGGSSPCMVNGVVALDVASAMSLRFGLRPALARDDDTLAGIKRRDVKNLVAGILMMHGYPLDYVCTIIVERGTATISEADAAAIEEVTGGQVRVRYTSMFSAELFGFDERPMGNYLGKAWLESYFNLVHNEAADIPGQMGARYEVQPGNLHGQIREAEGLVKAGEALPPELRREVRYPFRTLEEARGDLEQVFRRLNHRRDHELEGFEEVLEWREERLKQWRPGHELVGVPEAVLSNVETRTRLETPYERAARLKNGVRFERLHKSALPRLLEEHRRMRVEKIGEVSCKIDGKKHVWRDLDSPWLQNGAEYLAYYDRQDLRWLHLTDGDGAYCTSVPHVKAVRRDDAEAVSAAIKEKRALLNRKVAAVAKRNADRLSNRLADIDRNIELLEEVEAIDLVRGKGNAGEQNAPGLARSMEEVYAAQAELDSKRAARRQRAATGRLHADELLDDESAEDEVTVDAGRLSAESLL